MANIRSAEKQMRQAEKAKARNRAAKTRLRSQIKKARTAIDTKGADLNAVLSETYSVIDKTARKKVIKANTADRLSHRWLYLALAGVAGAAILVGPRRNRLGMGLALGCAVFSLQAIHYGLWMHYQDSLAYHPNLKQNEAPVKEKLRAEPVEARSATRTAAVESPAAAAASSSPAAVLRDVRPLGAAAP